MSPSFLKEFMGRHKKNINVHLEESKPEVIMSKEAVLDSVQTELDIARAELEKTKVALEEKRKELETTANRALDIKEAAIIQKQQTITNEQKAANEKIAQQKAFDNVPVTGKFINRRAPGQQVKLTYLKYNDDPVKWYTFDDGKVYTIPRGFADQINEHYHTPHFIQKAGEMDPNKPASAIHQVDTSNKKYSFVPVNF